MHRSKSVADITAGDLRTESLKLSPRKSSALPHKPKTNMEDEEIKAKQRKLFKYEPKISVSRSGRIQKAKIVFDPSDTDSKRHSMPNVVATKSTKSTKPVETPSSQPTASQKIEKKSTDEQNENKFGAPITKRRKTIAFEYGCIVCSRTDIKKGRFVICTECSNRGHFTCLRNNKLFKTADSEQNWQCSKCKNCEVCHKVKPNDLIYKCCSCSDSFHLSCLDPSLAKNIGRKKFTCGKCESKSKSEQARKTAFSKKSAGFAGFSHEESSSKSSSQKSNTDQCVIVSSKNNVIKVRMNVKGKKDGSSPTASSKLPAKEPKVDIADMLECEIKEEESTPTPEQDANHVNRSSPCETKDQTKNISTESVKITVRKDLVNESIELKPTNDNDDDETKLEYDTKTKFMPHENIPDVKKWDCDEVYTYFMGTTTAEYAQLFKENQIDGDALLLIKRDDVLNRFNLKLGPALRLYSHIVSLQYKNNNPILAWNEY